MSEGEISSRIAKAAEILSCHICSTASRSSYPAAAPVAMGCAIVRNPKVFCSMSRVEPRRKLRDTARNPESIELRVTSLYVTHDQIEAMTLSDRMLLVMNSGIIEQVGTPKEVYERPARCSSPTSSAPGR